MTTRDIIEKLRMWGHCYLYLIGGQIIAVKEAEAKKRGIDGWVGYYEPVADMDRLAKQIAGDIADAR